MGEGTTVSRAPKTEGNHRLQPLKDINLRNREAEQRDRLPILFTIKKLVMLSEAKDLGNRLAPRMQCSGLRSEPQEIRGTPLWRSVGTNSP